MQSRISRTKWSLVLWESVEAEGTHAYSRLTWLYIADTTESSWVHGAPWKPRYATGVVGLSAVAMQVCCPLQHSLPAPTGSHTLHPCPFNHKLDFRASAVNPCSARPYSFVEERIQHLLFRASSAGTQPA
eukprot:scaffold683_cov423-Prasinococcus_capsulatus_cf.AAC.6